MNADVPYKKQRAQLPLWFVQYNGPSLLGRSWLQHLQLDWQEIHAMRENSLCVLLDRHATVFQEELGEL